MGYGCPAKCATGIQRPLDLLELTALPETARAEIALLRGTALLCESCGCIYVVSRRGTAAVENFRLLQSGFRKATGVLLSRQLAS